MSHILIQNQGELPIWGIRLLGLSDKNDEQIGRFGTGLKEALALLARMELSPVIFSGETRFDFTVEEIDGQAEICFTVDRDCGRFSVGASHPMGISPNLGRHDWDDPWMIFREIICNAIDAGGLYHDVTSDEMRGVAGATRIYLPATAKMIQAYGSVHDRLLMLRETTEVYSNDHGKAIEKTGIEQCQVYHKGVWVQGSNEIKSLYDYDLSVLKLNESRSADWSDVRWEVADIVMHMPQEIIEKMIVLFVQNNDRSYYEYHAIEGRDFMFGVSTSKVWASAFNVVFGDNAVCIPPNQWDYDKVKAAGRTPIVVDSETLRKIFSKGGVPATLDVISSIQRDQKTVTDPNEKSQCRFNGIWQRFVGMEMTRGKDKPSLMIFEQREGLSEIVFGQYLNGVCYINKDCVGSEMEQVAMVEEICHHITGASDMSRDFQTFLVKAIENLMFGENHQVTA